MQQPIQSYPQLTSLISGWFHQDIDIEGETVEEIIKAFRPSSPQEERQLLIDDISQFLEISDDKIDAEFVRIFNPDIEPTGFAPTTRAFLEEILWCLSSEA